MTSFKNELATLFNNYSSILTDDDIDFCLLLSNNYKNKNYIEKLQIKLKIKIEYNELNVDYKMFCINTRNVFVNTDVENIETIQMTIYDDDVIFESCNKFKEHQHTLTYNGENIITLYQDNLEVNLLPFKKIIEENSLEITPKNLFKLITTIFDNDYSDIIYKIENNVDEEYCNCNDNDNIEFNKDSDISSSDDDEKTTV
jgi:hypothetical protein